MKACTINNSIQNKKIYVLKNILFFGKKIQYKIKYFVNNMFYEIIYNVNNKMFIKKPYINNNLRFSRIINTIKIKISNTKICILRNWLFNK